MKIKKNNLSPFHKTPTTPIRTARTNTHQSQKTNSFTIHPKNKQTQAQKTTTANTNLNTHIKHNQIDEILHRISSNCGRDNASIVLYKKTQIQNLRQIMREAQTIAKSINIQTHTVDSLKGQLKQQVINMFDGLRADINKKQQALLDELQQHIFNMKETMINKCYQKISLTKGIEQCQRDIDQYYYKIVQQLDVQEFKSVIKAYTDRFSYYIQKLQTAPSLQIQSTSIQHLHQEINTIKLAYHEGDQLTFNFSNNCSKFFVQEDHQGQIKSGRIHL